MTLHWLNPDTLGCQLENGLTRLTTPSTTRLSMDHRLLFTALEFWHHWDSNLGPAGPESSVLLTAPRFH